ncbi:MAG TPA: hypothetical protein VGN51_09415 [Acidimicrobiia bacterium]
MPKDPADVVLPILQPLLGDGEQLRGWCLATEQSTFSGHTTVVGITDQRLLVQAVDRKFHPKDDLLSVRPDELAKASSDGAGGGWWTASEAILDATALAVKLETTGGAKRKLTMMRGGGGMFGKLGGGAAQQQGIDALAEWLRAAG